MKLKTKIASILMGLSIMIASAVSFALIGKTTFNQASATSKTIIIDATSFGLSSTATSSADDYVYDGVTYTVSESAKLQSTKGVNRFTDSAILIGKEGKYIYNKTALPGKITKFEIYANKDASAKVSVSVNFGNSALTSYNSTNEYSQTLSTLDSVYDVTSTNMSGSRYFRYQVTNANNSQVEFRITCSVDENVPSIAIDQSCLNQNISSSGSMTFSATTENASGVPVVWSSSNTSVATINSSTGVATAVSSGSTTITATITVNSIDYSSDTTLHVLYDEPETFENMSIASIVGNSEGNGKRKFTAYVYIQSWWNSKSDVIPDEPDAFGNMIFVDSNNDTVCCYGCIAGDENTLVWDSLEGVYKFINDGSFLTSSVTSSLQPGDQLYVECIRSDYTNATNGTATIEVKAKILQVIRPDVSISSIDITDSDFTLLSTDGTRQLNYSILPANYTENILWESDDTSIATVSQTGLVTFVGSGDVLISLSNDDGSINDCVVVSCKYGATIGSSVVDTLTKSTTDATTTTYVNWSNKTISNGSGAIYAGNSAAGNNYIQLRSSNSSGIISTSSGGYAKKIVVDWNSSTIAGRTLDIYGKNTAYSEPSELYGSNKGTKIGSIECGVSTELVITGNYEYIGVRSNSNAMYLSSISITWENSKTATVSDVENIYELMEDWLHMLDYNDDLGYCADTEHAYYSYAKLFFNNEMSAEQRNYFLNNIANDYYEPAKERLLKWAEINGDELDTANNTLGSRGSMNQLNISSNSAVALAAIVLTTLSLTSLLYIKRKKLFSK